MLAQKQIQNPTARKINRGLVGCSMVAAFLLSACTTSTPQQSQTPGAANTATGGPSLPAEVRVVTHDSFHLPAELIAEFEAEHGMKLDFVAPGDAGALVNQLILTQGNPLGDVVYGIDNTFASRAVAAEVITPYQPEHPSAEAAAKFNDTGTEGLVAIDFSDVCLNVDLGYFASADLPIPETFADLTQPEYANLTAVTDPTTSSPGLAFLLGTIAAFGDDWQQYWADLHHNGVRVNTSWSQTYYTDFSAPNYGGDRPIVLSYASSIPAEVIEGEPTTAALLDTCFRQVEFAGLLAGGNHTAGALVIEWLLSDEVQSALPESMYVYPVSPTATIPADWAEYAQLTDTPWQLSAAEIAAGRDDWLREWAAIPSN